MIALGIGGFALLYSEIAILLNRHVPEIPGWGWLIIVFLLLGVVSLIAAFDPKIDLYDVYPSVFSLFNATGTPEIMDHHFWIAPCGALLAGIPFIAQMCLTFKQYRAPEITKR